jgi:hypothetical protein
VSRRPSPESEPQELTEAALQRLAEIACVPAEKGHEFFEQMVGAFQRAWLNYEKASESAHTPLPPPISAATRMQLEHIEKAGAQLQAVLLDCDEDARKWFARFYEAGSTWGFVEDAAAMRFNVQDARELLGIDSELVVGAILSSLRKVILAAAARSIYCKEVWKPSHLPGKKRAVNIGEAIYLGFDAFEHFVADIIVICGSLGAPLSLDKNDQSGTLRQFLEECTGALPPNFVPKGLPYSRLQQIKTYFS